GHTLKKEYPVLLRHLMNGNSQKARSFSGKVTDIHEFVYGRNSAGEDSDINKVASGDKFRVTYHDPCHLKKGLGIYQSPREILRSISDAEFVEMDEADACCGFGGIFSLNHYDLAADIGAKKAGSIKRSNAQVVATGCPGCKIHIEDSLNRAGMSVRVVHTVELLDKTLK
ncbi:MAG TPA: heterodisulfide reductase-related iron-sulfur binding cluster, partial [Candidatus Brocadiales bacterium]|nr:heterodisulfide reductase-related iron-sulfur binding cluster [Candidatus Brocadiales bacterium]